MFNIITDTNVVCVDGRLARPLYVAGSVVTPTFTFSQQLAMVFSLEQAMRVLTNLERIDPFVKMRKI